MRNGNVVKKKEVVVVKNGWDKKSKVKVIEDEYCEECDEIYEEIGKRIVEQRMREVN